MIPYFLTQDKKGTVKFNLDDHELVFFIPAIFFDRKYAEEVAGKIKILGIFNYAIKNIKTGKYSKLYVFDYPTVFATIPGEKLTIRNMEMKGLHTDDYTLLKYHKGDIVIDNVQIPQDVTNSELFYNMVTSGKLPTSSVRYDQLQNYFIDNMRLNGNDYKLNAQLFGLVIGDLACVVNDETKLFRHTNMENLYDYKLKNIKMSPKYVSPYSSYTSEVYDESIINASMVNKSGTSPMEKMFMGY